jgi:hypothetical protein
LGILAGAMTGRPLSVRFTGRRSAVAILALLGLAGLLASAPVASSHPVAKPKQHIITIRARIRVDSDPNQPQDLAMTNRGVFFTPSVISVGTVYIVISNTDNDDHYLEINGVQSRRIAAGGRAKIKVTFKHPGVYSAGLTSDDLSNVGPGLLKVVK